MRRRGFTMIELVIVLMIMAGLMTPFLAMYLSNYDAFASAYSQSSVQLDTQAAADRVFRRVATTGKYTVDSDNHGLAFADGSHVSLKDRHLCLKARGRIVEILPYLVSDFTVVRQHDVLTLNIEVEVAGRTHGAVQRIHQMYDFPKVGP